MSLRTIVDAEGSCCSSPLGYLGRWRYVGTRYFGKILIVEDFFSSVDSKQVSDYIYFVLWIFFGL